MGFINSQKQMAMDSEVQSDNSRWELDYDEVINNLKHSLNSEEQLQNGQWITPDNTKPKLNRTGVSDIISDLKILMNKGVPLANIDQNYAYAQTKALSKAFAWKLVINKTKWGVDKSQRKSLVYSYAQCVYLALTRPIGDKERMHRSKRITFKEDYKHDEVNPSEIGGI